MKIEIQCFYFLSLLILPIYAATALGGKSGGGGGVLVGGWQLIKNVTEPHVTEIGEFAVEEYNKESKSQLTFLSVVKGETQVVAGTNYRLIVATKDGGLTKNYQAVVWEKTPIINQLFLHCTISRELWSLVSALFGVS